jgi:hypothetical protein
MVSVSGELFLIKRTTICIQVRLCGTEPASSHETASSALICLNRGRGGLVVEAGPRVAASADLLAGSMMTVAGIRRVRFGSDSVML